MRAFIYRFPVRFHNQESNAISDDCFAVCGCVSGRSVMRSDYADDT